MLEVTTLHAVPATRAARIAFCLQDIIPRLIGWWQCGMKSVNTRFGPHETELLSVVITTPVMLRGMLLFSSTTMLRGLNVSTVGLFSPRWCLKLSGSGESLSELQAGHGIDVGGLVMLMSGFVGPVWMFVQLLGLEELAGWWWGHQGTRTQFLRYSSTMCFSASRWRTFSIRTLWWVSRDSNVCK